MSKLIIDNRTETLSNHECFHYISNVCGKGKISETRGVKHYCHIVSFDTFDDGEVTVYFKLNKASSTFIIMQKLDI